MTTIIGEKMSDRERWRDWGMCYTSGGTFFGKMNDPHGTPYLLPCILVHESAQVMGDSGGGIGIVRMCSFGPIGPFNTDQVRVYLSSEHGCPVVPANDLGDEDLEELTEKYDKALLAMNAQAEARRQQKGTIRRVPAGYMDQFGKPGKG